MAAGAGQACSWRTPIRPQQAREMARLIRELEYAVLHRGGMLPGNVERLRELPEYVAFVTRAEELGFVCRDMAPGRVDLAEIAARPQLLADGSLHELRRYVHVLVRAERWSDGWYSFVPDALQGGALGLVAERLETAFPSQPPGPIQARVQGHQAPRYK